MPAASHLHGSERGTGGEGRVVGDVLVVGRVAIEGLVHSQALEVARRVREKQVRDRRALGTAPLDAVHGPPEMGRRGHDALRPFWVPGSRIAGTLRMVEYNHARKIAETCRG